MDLDGEMKSNIMRLWAFAALVFISLSFVSAVVVITPPIVTTTTVVINQSVISSYNITYQNFAYNQSAPVITLLNGTYAGLWYNHTQSANLSIFNTYDARWSSTFNQSYENFAYNMSNWNLSGSNLFLKDTVWKVAIGGNSATSTLTVTGNVSISGNTSIDGSTFFVDTDNNRVGIGTELPKAKLDLDSIVVANSVTLL